MSGSLPAAARDDSVLELLVHSELSGAIQSVF